MREIIRFLKPYRSRILLAILAVMVSTLCDLLLPTVMSDILNKGVYEQNFPYILWCCVKMLLIALAGLGAVLVNLRCSSRVVNGFCADLREAIFCKVNSLTFEEFGKMGAAALVTRATHDVDTVSWIASELCGSVATIPLMFCGGVILAMSKDAVLSLILLACLPLIFVAVIAVGRHILPIWEKSDKLFDHQGNLMRQRLRGIRVIRAFQAEGQVHEQIARATRDMAEGAIRANVSMEMIWPLASFLFGLASVLIVYMGGWRMELGYPLSGGDIFAIVQYIALITNSVIMGAFTVISLPHAQVAAKRIGEVFHAQSMTDPEQTRDRPLSGHIRLENLSFCYEGAAEAAVQQVTMDIPAGSKVAVIGGTGAGKSTLVQMLMGFRKPTQGQVFLDGVPIRALSHRCIRENISCVLQNSTVYSGTVRENLLMGKPDATDGELWQALEIAQAADFVSEFSDGLEHELHQSGKNLSGGQKQRLSIARAVLKQAPIYVFDDSFSALDFLTEARLRSALAQRLEGRTQIVITQRISSAMHADCIYVMDRGMLVDHGTHRELLERCAIYREIYSSQTGGEEA